jgi:chromosomal replication initiation ATPase DnaA
MSAEQFEKILNVICKAYNITKEELLSKNRSGMVSLARHTLYRSLTHMGLNLPETGRATGRDHATVRHGIKVYKNMYETDEIFRLKSQSIREKIKQIAHED